ncbi:MAG TPA: bifunctional diaminohydroxyphosphoribosylaminopyrimidine deaminase/5-amino-6-(5-phosphoribosylamino)uracil reductase RibD [Methylomirabilota bacterium]|jgi:diaminohydroxyphosphoribosylaminopyrimidine deaminase/5-amino-6-(5-phosphoribosylamino)uracil reductase|nr:bifunctional diaminohydroxyphosphoribosylaminopyrimidine deaminase/5-amino-6-(5-phosphoribosylamino)uracil reductase RibD [Methylomirabilota bacterium]
MNKPQQDEIYMQRALDLAAKALGRTSPNPAVGAVVVRGGRIIGEGFHRRAGLPHAEIEALRKIKGSAKGATLYVNLEPCSHHGRTPPCVDAVIHAGFKRVVIGMVDPNPLVQGSGIRRLRRAGIEVTVGVLREQCQRLNEDFVTFIQTGRPMVILKLAASLDGRIATANGDSHWISGALSRRLVHELRNRVDAILVGAETVRLDDPQLTCRIRGGRDPLRIILDGRLTISPTARVCTQSSAAKTVVVTAENGGADHKRAALEQQGVEVLGFPAKQGRIRLTPLLQELGRRGIKSVMIEGGGQVAAAALQEGVVDKVFFFYGPTLLGGEGRPMIGPLGIDRVAAGLKLHTIELHRLEDDVLVTGYIGGKENSHVNRRGSR